MFIGDSRKACRIGMKERSIMLKMRKVMISVAPVAAAVQHLDPGKIADDVIACYQAGASMVHLHVRDANGRLTSDMTLLEETVKRIKGACDIVIEISTGGVSELTIGERCQPIYAPWAEAVSLNVGSVNLGTQVYRNPIMDVRYCVGELIRQEKRPEIEVFELGMIHTVQELLKEFSFTEPILFALVFGHEGEMPATEPALRHMRDFLYETFPEPGKILWGYTQANRRNWEMVKTALTMGASSIRIGFEDSDYLSETVRAAANADLIEQAVKITREKGLAPMTSADVRNMLQIPV